MLDSKGVITSDRENLTEQKKLFATDVVMFILSRKQ